MVTNTNLEPRRRESHIWERDPLDWYIEPDWCSQRLFEMAREWGWGLYHVWDPAAGCGRIVKSALAADIVAQGTDIQPRDPSVQRFDFFSNELGPEYKTALTIVSNPPFKHALKFAERALDMSTTRVALLLPARWVQGEKRSLWIEKTPLVRVLFLCPRPSMPPGEVIMRGEPPGNGRVDFAWFIWERGYRGQPTIGWCRR